MKELSWFDLPSRNESKNGLTTYFPLYFFGVPLYIQNRMATPQITSHKSQFFLMASEVYVQPWAKDRLPTQIFEKSRTANCQGKHPKYIRLIFSEKILGIQDLIYQTLQIADSWTWNLFIDTVRLWQPPFRLFYVKILKSYCMHFYFLIMAQY